VKRSLGAAFAVAVLAAGLVAASAAASPKPEPHGFTVPASFALRAGTARSHGFLIQLEAGGHRRVSITVSKGLLFTTYTVTGSASRNGIEADFGDLGHVSMRFHGRPETESDQGPVDCTGHPAFKEVGVLRGRFRFRGEDGFAVVSTRQLRAFAIHSRRRVCHFKARSDAEVDSLGVNEGRAGGGSPLAAVPGSRARKPRIEIDTLSVRSSSNGRRLTLDVFETRPSLLPLIVAAARERDGAVLVERAALSIPEHQSLEVSRPGAGPLSGVFTPPKPFQGKATYTTRPGLAPSWEGDLRVSFPGAPRTMLTGPGFHAQLCRAFSSRALRKCAKDGASAKTLARRLYGSGSHSQPFADARLSWSR
jgi:hypothetical protein